MVRAVTGGGKHPARDAAILDFANALKTRTIRAGRGHAPAQPLPFPYLLKILCQ